MLNMNDLQKRILNIAINLTKPHSYSQLLQNVVDESMSITNCDAGTLYILDENKLKFMIMITKSKGIRKGGDGRPIPLPPVDLDSQSVCAYVARNKTTMNIADVYNDQSYDWQGPKKYDELNNYHTQSLAVVPLIDHEQKVIGVIQLLNALDDNGNLIPFSFEKQYILEAIASLAAISLSNHNMINQMQALLESFVLAFTTAIDARTPYNANHTRHVTEYCRLFSEFINMKHADGSTDICLTENQVDQIIMAASLHDIGKLIVPLEVMNKADRLGGRLNEMQVRWKWLKTDIKVKLHSGMITLEQYNNDLAEYNRRIDYIVNANTAGYLSDDDFAEIDKLNDIMYLTSDNEWIDFITDEEVHELKIHKGTLTAEERQIIEMHAEYTSQILDKIVFGDKYNKVQFIAGSHHEALDGSGYPNKLIADKIPVEVRIISIMDVFDSLTSSDRPYRSKSSKESAMKILYAMVEEGKLDKDLVDLANEFFMNQEVL